MSPDPYDPYDLPERPPALGTVVEQDRGALPFALLHGEALVACAAWGLGESGVTPVDTGTPWSSVVAADEPYVLHDALCPATPGWFIAECVERSLAVDVVVVGVRAVTDTVKRVEGGVVGTTLDREQLWSVASPLVLPPRVVAALGERDGGGPDALDAGLDLARLVRALEALDPSYAAEHREAPAVAMRVRSGEDVAVLAAMTGPDRAG